MPDGVTIIDKLDEPSMGESSFKGRLPPLGGSPVTSGTMSKMDIYRAVASTNIGLIFWFDRKKLLGSYFCFSSTSRS